MIICYDGIPGQGMSYQSFRQIANHNQGLPTMKSFKQEQSADTSMTANDDVAMIPSDCARHLFQTAQHHANLPITVREALEALHKLKMRTDEDKISTKCQELINLLFKKYPGVVACPE